MILKLRINHQLVESELPMTEMKRINLHRVEDVATPMFPINRHLVEEDDTIPTVRISHLQDAEDVAQEVQTIGLHHAVECEIWRLTSDSREEEDTIPIRLINHHLVISVGMIGRVQNDLQNRNQKEVKKEPVEEKTERTTGLLSREEMREKAQRDREEHERLLATIKDSGRDAEAVHRGGDGRKKRLTREEVERNEREAKKQEELNAKYEAVSKGVAQKEERERKIKEMEQTVQEDFTRHADDKTMNEHLKDQLMGEDDPMMQSISAKRMKIKLKSEFVYPTYNGQCPVNRYNIAPGYRWDGVDRSNGFESKMALRGNRELAEAAAAYRAIAEIAE
ncbi:BUD13-like protein [Aphelenchoides besseyi]|nr:BUD13-like protein [Aphelenchoides besseyi]